VAVATQTPQRPVPAAERTANGHTAAPVPARTCVRGIDLAGDGGTWTSTLASTETCWASTFTCDKTAAGRLIVTNLRLPGQYDERLLASVGLQGPYYNWNRWYLPGVGKYLELDPIALEGGFNRSFTPDWYGYAEANPTRYVDPDGRVPLVLIGICAAGGCEALANLAIIGAAVTAGLGIGEIIKECDKAKTAPPPPPPCPPCTGQVPPPRIDENHAHYPCPGAHVHYYVWEQNPRTCQCFVKDRLACL